MKTVSMTVIVAAISLLLATASHADFFSISADVPLAYKFKESEGADKVSGLKLTANLPLLWGIGYENYSTTSNGIGANGADRKVDITLYDLFFDLPTPFVNISLGLGVGSGKVEESPPSTETFKDASLFQTFLTVGIPFYAVFDLHLGYHVIRGTANSTSGGSDFKIDGTMTSLGIRFGF